MILSHAYSRKTAFPTATLAALAFLAGAAGVRAEPAAATPAAHAAAPTGPAQTASVTIAAATTNPAATTPAAMVPAKETDIQGLMRLGASLTARGDCSSAEIAYWQVLEDPNLRTEEETTALLALARSYRIGGKLTQAAAIYEKFLKDHPSDERVPDALLALGRTLRDMGTYRAAISRFYSVINSTLKFPSAGMEHYELLAKTAQFEIAQTHFVAGEYADAAKYFARVNLLELAPSDRSLALFMTAFAQQLSGDLDTSVTTLRSFLDQWPQDERAPEARYLLATTLRQLKRPQEALAVTLNLLRDAKTKKGADAKRWSYWQRRTGNQVANEFFQAGDTLNALSVYRSLSEANDDPSWRVPLAYQVALCYDRLRQIGEAKAAYQIVVDAAKARPGAAAPTEQATELAQMAAWRIGHLEWFDAEDRHLDALFKVELAAQAASIAADIPPPKPLKAAVDIIHPAAEAQGAPAPKASPAVPAPLSTITQPTSSAPSS